MKRPMTKRAARQFVKRWKAINDFERQELRSTPPGEKFRQPEALMQSAAAFGWDGEERKTTEAVRTRWRRLQERYRA
jgi:hypothetical protein